MTLELLVENPACRNIGMQPFIQLVLLGLVSGGLGSLVSVIQSSFSLALLSIPEQMDSFLGATVQQTLYSVTTKRILTDDSKPEAGSVISIISGRDFLSNNQVGPLTIPLLVY